MSAGNPNWIKGGPSPNPAGRKPGTPNKQTPVSKYLRQIVDPEKLAEKLWALCMEGDLGAIRYVYDRLDGKPKETIETFPLQVPKVQWFPDDAEYPDGWEEPTKEATG